ncbi:unannotated protein [freshwater metagenome]|uniref:Unannotated protein n=1 Tax=freshwater metagenome TaxID=449393 RepID=A0A6J7IZ26_9ZZZZ|nr:hypothetical protein [Actinomycetota bacterium]
MSHVRVLVPARGHRRRSSVVAAALAAAVACLAGAPSAGAVQYQSDPHLDGPATVGVPVRLTRAQISYSPGSRFRMDAAYWYSCADARGETWTDSCEFRSNDHDSYTPTPEDEGRFLRVQQLGNEVARECGSYDFDTLRCEWYYDDERYAFAQSNVLGPVAGPAAPVADGAPTVTPAVGTAFRVGVPLAASTGAWQNSPASFAYQWRRCPAKTASASCTVIDGADTVEYTPVAADDGTYLRVRVTASNSAGSASQFSVSALVKAPAPVGTGTPAVTVETGTGFRVGTTLRTTSGGWDNDPGAYAYQWRRCPSKSANGSCTSIPGATGSTYELTNDDDGTYVRVNVTAKTSGGSATQTSASTLVKAPAPVGTGTPVVTVKTGSGFRVGNELQTTPGGWDNDPGTYAYQWRRCPSKSANGSCTSIPGATGSTYELTAADGGTYVRVNVTARNSGGSAVQYSPSTRVASAG